MSGVLAGPAKNGAPIVDRVDEKGRSEWKKKEGGEVLSPGVPDLKRFLCVQRVFSAFFMHTTFGKNVSGSSIYDSSQLGTKPALSPGSQVNDLSPGSQAKCRFVKTKLAEFSFKDKVPFFFFSFSSRSLSLKDIC